MIEINLLPEERRVKIKAATAKTVTAPAPEDLKKLFYAVPAVIGILVFIHIYLVIAQILASVSVGAMEKKRQALTPQMTGLSGFKSKFEIDSQDQQMMHDLAAKSIFWSRKLNRLSADLPAGIWISEISASPRVLSIRCSAVSLETDEIELINKFLSALKDDPDFYGDFSNYDLGSVQKRMLGSFEISDFPVTMEVKQR
jgi:Tfp pilus assembly protein PilN